MLLQPWKLTLFGSFELQLGDVCVTRFPTEKVGLLLAYLATSQSEFHTREELADLFWPDSEPEAGRVSLRQALASIRRLLEPPNVPAGSVLAASRSQITLNRDAVETDVAQWDRLRSASARANDLPAKVKKLQEAIDCYGGPFLPGAYMDWALTERQFRQEQFLDTLLSLTDALTQAGVLEGAIATAQRLLRTDAFHEDAHARLIRLFALQGNMGHARQQYATLTRLLQDEFDIEPSSAVKSLYVNLEHIAPGGAEFEQSVPINAPPPRQQLENEGTEPIRSPRLPIRLTRFFGREPELALLSEWLSKPDYRLLTITGMGGVGKTRLALQACQQPMRFGGGITFVSLSETLEPAQLLPAILHSMGMPALASSDPLTRLTAVIGSQPHLLVLDNFEQIAERGAETIRLLLENAAAVTCLVTSRQALNLEGEHELDLTPLPVPADELSAQGMAANPAVQMLVDRMRFRRPDFQVTPANAAAIGSLCSRLEGIPLAVELAAGWARDLTINQMRERLDRRFDLLVSRQHGVPLRHQSLRATVESSYQLLPIPLQEFFSKLSVFRGGWRTEMAEIAFVENPKVAGASDSLRSTSQMLRTLREHSLITAHEVGEHVRYGMLETLRAFGREMLTADQADRIGAQHLVWLLNFANEVSSNLHGKNQAFWLNRIEDELENFRGALEFATANNPVVGIRLANALYWFWYVRSYYSEGERWLTILLEQAAEAPEADRAWGLLAAGHLANCQSNNAIAVSRYKAALAIFEELGDARGIANATTRLGNAAQELRDIQSGYNLCAEAVSMFRKLDDASGLLLALFYRLNTLLEVGDPDEGEACFTEAFTLAESLGDLRFQSLLQFCFSNFRRRSGDIQGAFESFGSALELQRLLREPLSVSYLLRDLALLVSNLGNRDLAVTLYGGMRGLRRRIGYPLGQHEYETTQILETHLHADFTEDEYREAFIAGEELDFDACLALAARAIELN